MVAERFELKPTVLAHEFNDGSGLVLFERRSGAALALAMPLAELHTLLQSPDQELWLELYSHLADYCQPRP